MTPSSVPADPTIDPALFPEPAHLFDDESRSRVTPDAGTETLSEIDQVRAAWVLIQQRQYRAAAEQLDQVVEPSLNTQVPRRLARNLAAFEAHRPQVLRRILRAGIFDAMKRYPLATTGEGHAVPTKTRADGSRVMITAGPDPRARRRVDAAHRRGSGQRRAGRDRGPSGRLPLDRDLRGPAGAVPHHAAAGGDRRNQDSPAHRLPHAARLVGRERTHRPATIHLACRTQGFCRVQPTAGQREHDVAPPDRAGTHATRRRPAHRHHPGAAAAAAARKRLAAAGR